MKTTIGFILGFLLGVLATILIISFAAESESEGNSDLGLTLFPEKGECIPVKNDLKVIQVIEPNKALAESGFYADRLLVVLVNDEGIYYYDDQKISISKGQCVRQIGIYKYNTRLDFQKTVPVVVIE